MAERRGLGALLRLKGYHFATRLRPLSSAASRKDRENFSNQDQERRRLVKNVLPPFNTLVVGAGSAI